MKLQHVAFNVKIEVNGEHITEARDVVADFEGGVVWIGTTGVPFSRVLTMRRVENAPEPEPDIYEEPKEYPCPHCSEKFASGQGLGGHISTRHQGKKK